MSCIARVPIVVGVHFRLSLIIGLPALTPVVPCLFPPQSLARVPRVAGLRMHSMGMLGAMLGEGSSKDVLLSILAAMVRGRAYVVLPQLLVLRVLSPVPHPLLLPLLQCHQVEVIRVDGRMRVGTLITVHPSQCRGG